MAIVSDDMTITEVTDVRIADVAQPALLSHLRDVVDERDLDRRIAELVRTGGYQQPMTPARRGRKGGHHGTVRA